MRLADVLNLEKEADSLPLIKDYLSSSLTNLEYQAAFNYYLEIAMSLELFEYVSDEGKRVFSLIENQSQSMYYEKILSHLIQASLALGHLDEAKKYIDQRKRALPVVNQYLGLLDEIALKKALHEPYKEQLLRLLSDVIPDSVKIECHESLLAIYRDENQYHEALAEIEELYRFDLKYKYMYDELDILIHLEKYDEAKKKALAALKTNKRDIKIVYVLLNIYYLTEDYLKAANLEAEYEEFFEAEDETVRKKIYMLLVELYKKIDNKPSLTLYKNRLKNLNRKLTRQSKKVEQQPEQAKKVVVVEKTSDHKRVSKAFKKHLDDAIHLIEYAHLIDEKLPLREFLRQFFIETEKAISAQAFAIYLNQPTNNFFFYKKERLYDKTYTKMQVDNTYIQDVLSGKELFEQTAKMKWQKDIITGKPYDDQVGFVYALPIGDEGVFVCHLTEILEDPAVYYDLLKLISAILFAHVIDEKRLKKLKSTNQFHTHVIQSPIFAYRQMTQTQSTFNDQAMKLFNIEKHHHFELFLRDVSYEYVRQYKDIVQSLFAKPGKSEQFLYTYQGKHILEKMYSILYQDDVTIISIFLDQTKDIEQAKSLVLKATVDPETNLANRHAFADAFDQYLDQKVSFCLIEFQDDLKHIYGLEQMALFFKEFSQVTKKHFHDAETYRFDFNQLMVVLSFNDIRRVTKSVKQYMRMIEQYQSNILPHETYHVSMGVLRYPVVTVEKHHDKLLRFFDIALENAKRNHDEHVSYFVFKDYENELFEQQVIDYLNQAIETKDIGLVFNQIIDLKSNIVWQYESELVLTNLVIDAKYLLKIAKKRHRLVELERFHIKQVCEFLLELEKETARLIKVTIPISKETFSDPSFNPFILGTLKQYGIPYEFIRLKCQAQLKPHQHRHQVQELVDHGIGMDTTHLETAVFYPFHALHETFLKADEKYGVYLSQLQQLTASYHMAFIIRNVKTKEQKEWLLRLGIQYMQGHMYKPLPAPVLFRKIKDSL